MKLLKNNMWTLFGLALVLMVAFTGDASAQLTSGSVVETGLHKASVVFRSVRTIVFVIGGFGLVGLAVQAIFGKVKWPWFGALAVGLGVLAAAGSLIEYVTGSNATTSDTNSGYVDTFGQAAGNK